MSMPSGSSDRMTSLTSWPSTTGRASTSLSFLTTGGATEEVARHHHPEAGLPALGGHQDQLRPARSAPGIPFQRAASASFAVAQLVERTW